MVEPQVFQMKEFELMTIFPHLVRPQDKVLGDTDQLPAYNVDSTPIPNI